MAGKISLRDRAKSLWIKGMNTIGNTAAHIADNTRHKVDELTIQNRRREVRTDVASTVYALWLKGETFPETDTKMLVELKQLDDQLNDLRAEKYAPAERQTVSEADMDGELPSDEKEAATGEAEKKPLENVPETAGLKAMEAPLRQIVENAGDEASVVANEVRNGQGNYGYNAATGQYGDMLEMGILDPTKVTRSALQYAASVAGLMITTECMITELPKKDAPAAPAGAGMGGMGGMM